MSVPAVGADLEAAAAVPHEDHRGGDLPLHLAPRELQGRCPITLPGHT